MDKQTARRRKAEREARARAADGNWPELARALAAGQQPKGDDDAEEMLSEDTPTGLLSQLAEDEDDLDPNERAERASIEEAARQARLDAFGQALATKRMQAVQARQQSGIEDIWREDEEHYEGVDDANRGERVTLKPRDPNGLGGATVRDPLTQTGSTLFVNITRAYVDFSAGRAADMLLPTDEPNWDLKETPMPDVIAMMGSDERIEMPPGAALAPGAPATYGEAAEQMYAEAKESVNKAKRRIEDWLEEGQYYAEQRKVLRDAAKVGVGILKGPFPVKRTSRAIVRDERTGQFSMQVEKKMAPLSRRISYWNFYPDDGCGENIHDGSFTWEKDSITARKLRDLRGTKDADGRPLYLDDVINICLREGPQRKFEGETSYNARDAENYEIWYYHGVASAEDLRAAGVDAEEGEVLPVMVTMVNDRVIKAALTTLDSGEFPYDVMVWQEREGHWAGIGVSRQVRASQRIVNAGVRNLMDNAGFAAGPQFVLAEDIVKPMARGASYAMEPRKMWKMAPDSNINDVTKAFAAVVLPMLTDELLGIVQFGLKTAEDVTGMPMLMQGQQGKAPDTVGGMQIVSNNSNTPLRAIAKLWDDRITVPHLLRYYEWLLLYGPEADEKGEFVVAARGSSALFERDAQNQAILQMAAIVKDPTYRIDPQRWFKEFLRAQRLDPDRFQYTDAEWSQIEQQMQQQGQPVDPRLQAAQIAADARLEAARIAAGVQQQRIDRDADRDAIFAEEEAARTRANAEAHQAELNLQLQLALLDYANREKLSLDQAKAKLADTAMKLKTQERLSAMTAATALRKERTKQVSVPPTEPAGRAAPGQAYQA